MPESSGSMIRTLAPLVMAAWASVKLGGVAALRVLHGELRGRKARRRQRLRQVGRVEFGVPGRGNGVRQDHGDVALARGGERLQRRHRGRSLGSNWCERD